MEKNKLTKNIIFSILNVFISIIVMFLFYNFLLRNIGNQKLGLWSLVISVISIANLANLGFSASVTTYVSKFISSGNKTKAFKVIETAFISSAFISGLILIVAYPIIMWYFKNIKLYDAQVILPFVLFSFWLTILISVISAGFDGILHMDTRVILQLTGLVGNLLLCFILVPKYNLLGVAVAQLLQALVVLFFSWYLLRKQFINSPKLPSKWDKEIFSLIAKFSIKFQLIPLSQTLCDPISKIFLLKFGGLSYVSYYEMANKMLSQLRILFISASQVLLPIFASLKKDDKQTFSKLYIDSLAIIIYLGFPVFMFILAVLPTISIIWIGHYESIFVNITLILSAGFLISTIAIPSYYVGIATEKIKWITIGHVIIAVLNLIFGYFFGYFLGYIGVVLAWVISWGIGTLVFVISHHLTFDIDLKTFITKENKLLIITSTMFFFIMIFFTPNNLFLNTKVFSLFILLFLFLIIIPMWIHPLRYKITNLILNKFK